MKKIRVGVLFGGRSGEHEVSLASAEAVLSALDRDRYDAVPIGITRSGRWRLTASPRLLLDTDSSANLPDGPEVAGTSAAELLVSSRSEADSERGIDVVIPVLHGPFGEDGTVQGFLETLDIPYVGSGVLGSALAMDKAAMKASLEHAGLPSLRWVLLVGSEWSRDPDGALGRIEESVPYPMFVKPCNMGSSVGIAKVWSRGDLAAAIHRAFRYDRRVIVEEGIDAREVECSVLGNDDPIVSVPGEIIPHHDYYDYDSKYTEGLADLVIPARLSPEQTKAVQEMARRTFIAVDAAGLARVDFFIRKSDGAVIVNEINTMPGFTTTSMFPKLWEASGISYSDLLDKLIQLAFDRHAEQQRRSLKRSD